MAHLGKATNHVSRAARRAPTGQSAQNKELLNPHKTLLSLGSLNPAFKLSIKLSKPYALEDG